MIKTLAFQWFEPSFNASENRRTIGGGGLSGGDNHVSKMGPMRVTNDPGKTKNGPVRPPARAASFRFAVPALGEIVFLARLDQLALLHHMAEDERALLTLDVQQVRDVLPVGEARP